MLFVWLVLPCFLVGGFVWLGGWRLTFATVDWLMLMTYGLIFNACIVAHRIWKHLSRRKCLSIDLDLETARLMETWPRKIDEITALKDCRFELLPIHISNGRWSWDGHCLLAWVGHHHFALSVRKTIEQTEAAFPQQLRDRGFKPELELLPLRTRMPL